MALKSKHRNLSFDVLRWMEENDDVRSLDKSISDSSILQNGSFLTDHQSIGKKKKKKKKNKKKLNKVESIESQGSVVLGTDDIVNLDFIDEVELGGGREVYSYKAMRSSVVTVVEEKGDNKCNGVNGGLRFGGTLRKRNTGSGRSGGGEDGCSSGIEVEENGKKEPFKNENGNGVVQFGGKLRQRRISGGGDESWSSGIMVEENGKEVAQFGGKLRQRRISGGGDDSWSSGIMVEENGKEVAQFGGSLRQRRISGGGDESWCSGMMVAENGKEERDSKCNGVNGVLQFGGKLRQRRISGGGDDIWSSGIAGEENGQQEIRMNEKEERGVMESDSSSKKSEILNERTLDTEVSLDWKQFMATDPRCK